MVHLVNTESVFETCTLFQKRVRYWRGRGRARQMILRCLTREDSLSKLLANPPKAQRKKQRVCARRTFPTRQPREKSGEASLPGGSIGRKARRDRGPRLDYTDPCSMGTLWNSFLDIPERDGLTGRHRTRMLRVLRGDIECP
ncbi:hypothetical protein K0M31_017872 [Melipona bicolor]|uniref:Uncharacterized protein n=1 Tax=Melipona bicolor TaxID=60889 RepID=A0AA40KSV7_9HYME|nr:hypothetical protein K0M31_017872 [Melipona bicolor]